MAEEEQPSVEDGNTEVDLRWAAEKRGPRVANDDTLWSDIDINLSDDRKVRKALKPQNCWRLLST